MKNIYIVAVASISIALAPALAFADTNVNLAEIASILESLQAAVLTIANQMQQLITHPAATTADITNDGFVSEDDWTFMEDKWFSADATADINGDGIVNSIDFGILNRNWSTTVR